MIIIKEIFKDYFSTVTIIFDEMIDVSKEVIAFTFFQMVAEVITITSFKQYIQYGRAQYDYMMVAKVIKPKFQTLQSFLGWVDSI